MRNKIYAERFYELTFTVIILCGKIRRWERVRTEMANTKIAWNIYADIFVKQYTAIR